MHGVNFVPSHSFLFAFPHYLFVSLTRRLFIFPSFHHLRFACHFRSPLLTNAIIISHVQCQLRDILYFCVYKYNSCHLHIYEILFLIRFSCRFHGSLFYVSVSISRLSLLHSFFFRVNFALLFLFPFFYFVSGKATRFFFSRGRFLLL